MNDVGQVEKTVLNCVEDINETADIIGKRAYEIQDRLLILNDIILGGKNLIEEKKVARPDLTGYIPLHLQKLGDILGQLVKVGELLKPLEEQFLKQ